VGSSSVRRAAQVLALRPDVKIVPFRGNVETRLKKLDDGLVDATFLACAGLNRLGLSERITSAIPITEMLPAVAQGAVGIEIRDGDDATRALVAAINHGPTETAVACERAFLTVLDGSCRTPIAGHAMIAGREISFTGEALTLDGKHAFRAKRFGPRGNAAALGREAGEEVKANGGALLTH
jgi:hydroxymethylbilane synthase